MRKPSPALVVAIIALVVALTGATLAAIPDNGVVHGCYQTAPGTNGLRQLGVRDTTESCPAGFAPVDWNVVGQTGPTGPVGPAGAGGPPGPSLAPSAYATYYGGPNYKQLSSGTGGPHLASLNLNPG